MVNAQQKALNRATFAGTAALTQHQRAKQIEAPDVVELLTDLMVVCDVNGEDFRAALLMASEHYNYMRANQ